MDDQADTVGTQGTYSGEDTEAGRGQSAGEEGECCGGHGHRYGHGGAEGQGCGCGAGAPAEGGMDAHQAGRQHHGRGGGGCCGGHGEHGGHGHHGFRRAPTAAEQIAMLEQYLKDLKAETLAVEERLTQLKAVG